MSAEIRPDRKWSLEENGFRIRIPRVLRFLLGGSRKSNILEVVIRAVVVRRLRFKEVLLSGSPLWLSLRGLFRLQHMDKKYNVN